MSDKVDNAGKPAALPPPQKKTITKRTSVVSTEDADKLIKQKLAQGAKVIQQDGKILIQSQAKPMFAKAQAHLKPTTPAETQAGALEGAQKQQGTTRLESRTEMSQVQAAKTATAGRLGDTPVLPKAQITKPDKAVINSFLSKFGENSSLQKLLGDEGQLTQRAEKAFATVMSGPGSGILGTTPGERKYLLMLLLLELGYQNKEINRAQTKMGQKLREGSTQITNDQSKIEIIASKTQGFCNYVQKMMDADAKVRDDVKDAAKEIWKNINNIRDIKAKEELQAAQKESREANASTARLFGPQPPREASEVATARDAYRNAATGSPPAAGPELERLRGAYVDVAGERAVLDNEASPPPIGTAEQRRGREEQFGSNAAAARTRADNATANLRREEGEFRQTTAGTQTFQALIDHPTWPPGAAQAFGRARSEAMLARTRITPESDASKMDELLEKQKNGTLTDAERQELDELSNKTPELHEYRALADQASRIERIANDEERFNSSDRPGSAEGHTDWPAVERDLQRYSRSTSPEHAGGLPEEVPPPNPAPTPTSAYNALDTRLSAAEARLDAHRSGADGSGTASAELQGTRAAERAAAREEVSTGGELARARSDGRELETRAESVRLRLGQTRPPPSPEEATRLRAEAADIRRLQGTQAQRIEAASQRHSRAIDEHHRLRDGNDVMRRSRAEDRASPDQARDLAARGTALTQANAGLNSAETSFSRANQANTDFDQLTALDAERATLTTPPTGESDTARATREGRLATINEERGSLLRARGLPATASDADIATARTAAEGEYRTAAANLGNARRAQATASANYAGTLEGIGARPPAAGPLPDGAPRTGYARVPEGDSGRHFGIPRPTERFTDGRTMLDEAGRAGDEAHANYWALHPGETVTPTVPNPDGRAYTEASYDAEFSRPPMVTNEAGERVPLQIGEPPRAPTSEELANPFSIENPADRARVLDYASRDAAARAYVIDRQVQDAQEFSELTNRSHWSEADARTYLDARRAAVAAESDLYNHIPASERGPNFPEHVPYETGDTPRARAVAAYYSTRRDADVAQLEGTARSHTPPADITAARAEVDRFYGSPTSTPPGGLLGARAAATDPAAQASADDALAESRRLRQAASPAERTDPRPEHQLLDDSKQQVDGPSFWRAIAINMGKLETWQKVGRILETDMPNVALRYADALINSFTQIAGRDIQEFDALFADMRQELARANALTSSDWARTLAAMERTLKSMNR